MTDLLFRRPRLLALVLVLIVVAGLGALSTLPRAEDPKLTDRFGLVLTRFPGADAGLVEALITDPLEDELREIEEIGELVSTSLAGSSTINIELSDDVTAVDEVWSRVRDRVEDAARSFPVGALPPEFEEQDNQAYTLIVGLTWELDSPPELGVMGRIAEEIADGLRRVPGTKDVDVIGEPVEEVLVEVDAASVAARGLSMRQVADTIRGADAKVSSGRIHGSSNDLLLEVSGALETLTRIAELPLVQSADGTIVRVGDVGRVAKEPVDPPPSIALLSGAEGIAIAARMQTGRRVDVWAAGARIALHEARATLPRGVAARVLFDQSRYTEARLSDLFGNFVIGALLVGLVVLVTMGWRAALLVGSALPLTSLMVLAGMRILGVPIHQMSVTGLIVALGLMIDNAIVMVDEFHQRLHAGRTVREAVRATVREMSVPLLGSTVTTVLAFMPIALLPGPAGEFVGTIAVSVILALCSSLFLALTVVPALSGLFARVDSGEGTGFWQRGISLPGPAALYCRMLAVVADRPALGVLAGIVLPVVGFTRFGALDEQFFPAADRDQFQVELRLPWQTPIGRTRERALVARELLLSHPAVRDVHWFVGESAPRFYYNVLDGRENVPFYAQALVQLESEEDSLAVVEELQRILDRELHDLQPLARPIEQGPPFDAPVELRIFGPDVSRLRALGEEVRVVMASASTVTHTRMTMEGGQPKLRLRLDEEEARLLSLDNRGVADRLLGATDGIVGGSLIEATEELPVRVRLADAARSDAERMRTIELATDAGWTPLEAIGELELVAEDASIPHRHGERCNTVQGYVIAGSLPSVAVREVRERLSEAGFSLPPGYRMEWGGEAAERDEAVGGLLATATLLMVLMAASLVLSFDSFRMASIIGAVAFLSSGLSILALWLFGWPFGFMAIVGTMGLVGVAVNDSIVVLSALRRDARARDGDRDAIVGVVFRATRHLSSTSITTIAGFAPLLIAGGGFWPPLAVAIAGGVAGATFLAVTFVPGAFLLLTRRRPREDAAGWTPLFGDGTRSSALGVSAARR